MFGMLTNSQPLLALEDAKLLVERMTLKKVRSGADKSTGCNPHHSCIQDVALGQQQQQRPYEGRRLQSGCLLMFKQFV